MKTVKGSFWITFHDLYVSGRQLPGTTAERRKPQWYAGVLRQKVLNTLMLSVLRGDPDPRKRRKRAELLLTADR